MIQAQKLQVLGNTGVRLELLSLYKLVVGIPSKDPYRGAAPVALSRRLCIFYRYPPISTACIGKANKVSLARLREPACNFALRACMHIYSYSSRYPLPVLVLVQLYMNRFPPVIDQA